MAYVLQQVLVTISIKSSSSSSTLNSANTPPRRPALRAMATERVAYLPDPVKREDEPGYPSPAFWDRLLEVGLPAELISVEDVCSGCLSRFSVLCVPGGFVLNYQSRLGSAGAALVAEFVRNGGGYVGVCAGAYLGSTMCLSLLPVEVVVSAEILNP